MTWGEYDSKHGFYIWDTETNDMEFVENPIKLFEKVEVNEETDVNSLDISDTYVRIVPVGDSEKLDEILKDIRKKSSAKIDIIEEEIEFTLIDGTIEFDTIDKYIKDYIGASNIDEEEKPAILGVLMNAYEQTN